MRRQRARGVSSRGLDPALAEEEARKSALILEARLLRKQLDEEAAADKLAEAARIEERLADACAAKGLVEKSLLHRFSAVSCWAQAGNFYRAIALGREVLLQPGLPERLRTRVEEYVQTLRQRRARWYQALAPADAVGEG